MIDFEDKRISGLVKCWRLLVRITCFMVGILIPVSAIWLIVKYKGGLSFALAGVLIVLCWIMEVQTKITSKLTSVKRLKRMCIGAGLWVPGLIFFVVSQSGGEDSAAAAANVGGWSNMNGLGKAGSILLMLVLGAGAIIMGLYALFALVNLPLFSCVLFFQAATSLGKDILPMTITNRFSYDGKPENWWGNSKLPIILVIVHSVLVLFITVIVLVAPV